MIMLTLKEVLMNRDGLTSHQADARIAEAKQEVLDGEDPEELLRYDFGVEPDYIFDLLD